MCRQLYVQVCSLPQCLEDSTCPHTNDIKSFDFQISKCPQSQFWEPPHLALTPGQEQVLCICNTCEACGLPLICCFYPYSQPILFCLIIFYPTPFFSLHLCFPVESAVVEIIDFSDSGLRIIEMIYCMLVTFTYLLSTTLLGLFMNYLILIIFFIIMSFF